MPRATPLDPVKRKEREDAYRRAHREEFRRYRRKYYHAHKAETAKQRDPDKMRLHSLRQRDKNPEAYSRYHREAVRRHRAKVGAAAVAFAVRQRYYLKRSRGFHSIAEWEALKDQYAHCCLACGRQEPFADLHYPWLTEDHVVPLTRGGTNTIANIQPLCIRCNSIKKTKTIDYRFPGESRAA